MANEKSIEMRLPSLDELFSSQEERDDAKLKRIYEIPIEEIDPFDFGDQYDINGNQLRNYDEEPVINVLEFVYDDQTAPREMILAGTMTYFDRFGGLYGDGGNIIKMEYLGRKWEP